MISVILSFNREHMQSRAVSGDGLRQVRRGPEEPGKENLIPAGPELQAASPRLPQTPCLLFSSGCLWLVLGRSSKLSRKGRGREAGWWSTEAETLHLVLSSRPAIIHWITWGKLLNFSRLLCLRWWHQNGNDNSYLLGLSCGINKWIHVLILRTVLAHGKRSVSSPFFLVMSGAVIGSGALRSSSGSILSLITQNSHFGLAAFPKPVWTLKKLSVRPSHLSLMPAKLLLAVSAV